MTKPALTKQIVRELADRIRAEAMEACMKAHEYSDLSNARALAALKERAACKKAISNDLYALLDGPDEAAK